jgi:molybdenum cofactor synthesis domain-containing protein
MEKITASVLIIGNEILSGRTQDLNIQFIASHLSEIGVHLQEVRIIPDKEEHIIKNVLELSNLYDYVFTTGGIGPTHDDITSESMAKAFSRELEQNKEAYRLIKEGYELRGKEMVPASAKMAIMPTGVKLIDNDITAAPGFIIENIYVMAGIPDIMQSMFLHILPSLKKGGAIISRQITILEGEGKVAMAFEELQKKYPEIDMGSYPFIHNGNHATSLVLRGENHTILENAYLELQNMVKAYEILT